MSNKKLPKAKKNDLEWQDKIAKNVEKERVQLNHPQGFERFTQIVNKLTKKKT